ncbi:MAG: type III polyketide synthase [Actinomycetes bacterium]
MTSSIVSVAPVLPDHKYAQDEITEMFAGLVLPDAEQSLLRQLHRSAGVEHRYLALPLDRYPRLTSFREANDVFISVGLDLAERAVRDALAQAGLAPSDVDLLLVTSVTGVAAPSLDARLVGRLGLRPDVKRIPVFGLGCVAGAAGIARLHDYLRGDPDGVAVLVSVELCSLTLQRDDASTANLVASGLFGDGACAVVMAGRDRAASLDGGPAAPSVVATRSRLYPDTDRVMGWDVGATGFRIVLAASVADVVRQHLEKDVAGFLGDHGLGIGSVQRWVSHPGGPKVLEAVQESLSLPPDALRHAWESLRSVGNLSSSSVLHVLAATLQDDAPPPGAHGVLLAMGPGFCAELVLLRWPGDEVADLPPKAGGTPSRTARTVAA